VAGVLGGSLLLLAVLALRADVATLGRLLPPGDLGAVRDHLRSFGPWAPVASFALIQLQALLAPVPSFPLVWANGFLFGALWGGLLSWASILVSALLCFTLARLCGRPLVERLVRPAALRRADRLFERYGAAAVLVGRLLPLTAFDLLSYAAGLTRLRVGPFLLATGLGMTPATFLMAAAGDVGGRAAGWPLAGGAVIAALAGGALLLRGLRRAGAPAGSARPEASAP
jgi:uncharacterized membrane protein YdjX (TVP38/TMEM64 family)